MEITTVNHLFMDNKIVPHLVDKSHKKNTFPYPSYEYCLFFDHLQDELKIVHRSRILSNGTLQYDNFGFQNIGLYSMKAILDLNVFLPSFFSSTFFQNHHDIALYIHRIFA